MRLNNLRSFMSADFDFYNACNNIKLNKTTFNDEFLQLKYKTKECILCLAVL